jgi:hypothetical protein
MKRLHMPWTWTDFWINNLSGNMDVRFGIWNIKSLNRAGSLMTVSGEVSKYKLDLMGGQEVRWNGNGTELG